MGPAVVVDVVAVVHAVAAPKQKMLSFIITFNLQCHHSWPGCGNNCGGEKPIFFPWIRLS